MDRTKKLTQCGLVLILAMVFILCTFVSAYAADTASLDFSKSGSIILTLKDGDDKAVSGGEISLYEVAVLSLEDGSMTYTYTEAFNSCTEKLDADEVALANALAKYVEANDISGTTASVGEDGTVSFENLELGLYLVVQTVASEDYETINPFVVTVPIDSDGVWDYSVDGSPKVGTVTPIEPEDNLPTPTPTPTSTTTTTTTTLPQTGQLNWPIPVLAVCGVLLFTIGWAIKKSERKENDA